MLTTVLKKNCAGCHSDTRKGTAGNLTLQNFSVLNALGTRGSRGLPQVPANGPGVSPIHAASGVGYGEGFAANAHRHAPDAWMASVKYLVEDLKLDVNARDYKGSFFAYEPATITSNYHRTLTSINDRRRRGWLRIRAAYWSVRSSAWNRAALPP